MSGLEKDTDLVGSQLLFQGLESTCSMGIERVAIGGKAVTHRFTNFSVGIGRTADVGPDAFPTVMIQVKNAHEVARIANIHGVGQCLFAVGGMVFARLQILIKHIVGVVGSNESFHGESHALGDETCRDVAEVSAGRTKNELLVLSQQFLPELGVGVEIVECLGQETGHIDAVGTCRETPASLRPDNRRKLRLLQWL